MEQLKSTPVDWIDKDVLGFVINAAFSDDNTQRIAAWLDGLHKAAPEGIYSMKPNGLHITVLDWVAPLLNYGGIDKRALYSALRTTYDSAFRHITGTMSPFNVRFNELRVTPGTIILIGQDQGEFQSLRTKFTESTPLPEGGKQPPTIIHSSLARFIAPELDLGPIKEYASTHPLDLTQYISEFRLVETRKEPMRDFSIIDTYSLSA